MDEREPIEKLQKILLLCQKTQKKLTNKTAELDELRDYFQEVDPVTIENIIFDLLNYRFMDANGVSKCLSQKKPNSIKSK